MAADQEDAGLDRLGGGEHQGLDARFEVEAVEAVGGPAARVLDEDPDEAERRGPGERVAAAACRVGAEEAGEVSHRLRRARRRGPGRPPAAGA